MTDAFEWIFERAIPEPNTGCFLWEGGLNSSGYGYHRKAYELAVGPVPDGLHLDHGCRVKCCINPDHLSPVTRSKNARLGVFKRASATHCLNGHKFTEENTGLRLHKDTRLGDRWKRFCRTCDLESHRVSKRRAYREAKGGVVRPRLEALTHCPQGHPYDETNTGLTVNSKRRTRWCRQCKRDQEKARGPRHRNKKPA